MNDNPKGLPKELPEELRGWNWGAFLLSWIWGLGNGVYIALLALLPIANIIMMFVLGIKGNEWAWKAGGWKSIEHFKRVQKLWAIWGLIIFVAAIVLIIIVVTYILNSMPTRL